MLHACHVFECLLPLLANFSHTFTDDHRLMVMMLAAVSAVINLAIVTFWVLEAIKSCLHLERAWAFRHMFFLEEISDLSFSTNSCS